MSCQQFQESWEILVFSTVRFLGAFNLLKCVENLQKGNVTSGVHKYLATEPFPKGHLMQLECPSMHSAKC